MKEFFENKNVIMVGPSATLIGKNKGEFIDAFDTVVRLNKSVPINKDLPHDIGSRTDVLYHCLDEPAKSKVNVDNYIAEGVKAVIASYPPLSFTLMNINKFKSMNKSRLAFETTNLGKYKELEKETGTRPNTGLLALVDILSRNVNKLYLTGFCFYQNFYYEGYTNLPKSQYSKVAESPAHDQNKQMKYWAKLYKEDNRIEIDDVLKQIFTEKNLI